MKIYRIANYMFKERTMSEEDWRSKFTELSQQIEELKAKPAEEDSDAF